MYVLTCKMLTLVIYVNGSVICQVSTEVRLGGSVMNLRFLWVIKVKSTVFLTQTDVGFKYIEGNIVFHLLGMYFVVIEDWLHDKIWAFAIITLGGVNFQISSSSG